MFDFADVTIYSYQNGEKEVFVTNYFIKLTILPFLLIQH